MEEYHTSVLLQEAVDALAVQSGRIYVDATLGAGGHAREIIKRGGKVIGIDQDDEAITHAKTVLEAEITKHNLASDTFHALQGNFRDIADLLQKHGISSIAGVIFDLGVSSHQIEKKERGFSFQNDGPLDMRMDKHVSVSAKDLVNGLTKGELTTLFLKFGEERHAKKIAENIVTARQKSPIETTSMLADIVVRSQKNFWKEVSSKQKALLCAKVFQALRIAVNDELYVIEKGLQTVVDIVAPQGRIAVISFHSLEDRIVKQTFVDFEKKGMGAIATKKPIYPTQQEMNSNRRSRSAKLRVFIKN